MSGKRRFVIEECSVKLPKEYNGHFESVSPYKAAFKAARSIFRISHTRKSKVTFTLRESTQGSEKKEYTYVGEKSKLDNPILRTDKTGKPIIGSNGKQVIITHSYSIKASK